MYLYKSVTCLTMTATMVNPVFCCVMTPSPSPVMMNLERGCQEEYCIRS